MAAASSELFRADDGAVRVTANYDDVTLIVASFQLLTGPQTAFVQITDGTHTFSGAIPANTNQTVPAPANLQLTTVQHVIAAASLYFRCPA